MSTPSTPCERRAVMEARGAQRELETPTASQRDGDVTRDAAPTPCCCDGVGSVHAARGAGRRVTTSPRHCRAHRAALTHPGCGRTNLVAATCLRPDGDTAAAGEGTLLEAAWRQGLRGHALHCGLPLGC